MFVHTSPQISMPPTLTFVIRVSILSGVLRWGPKCTDDTNKSKWNYMSKCTYNPSTLPALVLSLAPECNSPNNNSLWILLQFALCIFKVSQCHLEHSQSNEKYNIVLKFNSQDTKYKLCIYVLMIGTVTISKIASFSYSRKWTLFT